MLNQLDDVMKKSPVHLEDRFHVLDGVERANCEAHCVPVSLSKIQIIPDSQKESQ